MRFGRGKTTSTRTGYTFAGWTLIPNEYQQVDYIESTGTQYIDTGFVPNNNTRIVLDFQNTSISLSALYGGRKGTSSEVFGMWVDNTTAYPHYGNVGYDTIPITISSSTRYTYDMNKNITTVNGTTKTATAVTFDSGYSLTIFAINNQGSVDSRRASGKLYSAKIYNNGTLIRDLVPCYRKSDNIVGMYDRVNDMFYTNSGTGSFNYGSESYITSNITVSIPNNHMIYSNWTSNKYRITTTANGGTITPSTTTPTYGTEFNIKATKTVTITGNANNTGATVGSATSGKQTFAGWTSTSGLNTSTAKYGTASNSVTTSWTNGSTKVGAATTYFNNLTPTKDATVALVANWTPVAFNLPTVTKTGYTCNWNTASDGSGTSYDSGASYTPSANSNAAITMYAVCTINSYYFDLNWNLDGSGYQASNSNGAITAGLKIGGVDKGYVSDHYTQYPYGTTWKIYGVKLNGTSISYTASGTVGASNTSHSININTLTIGVNNSSYGSVSVSSLYVLRNATYTTSGSTLTLSDGRKVTASAKSATGYTTALSSWSPTSGRISTATSVTANFTRTANQYTVTFEDNRFHPTERTENGLTISYDPNTSYLTLNGTPTTSVFPISIDSGHVFIEGEQYKMTFTYLSGSLTKNDSYSFPLELKNGSSDLSTRNVVDTEFPASGSSSVTLTVSSTGASEGNRLVNWLWVNSSGAVTFNNYVVKVTVTKVQTKTVTLNSTYGDLPTPTREGYTFNGWYTAETGGTQVTSTTNVTTIGDHTLYAQWTKATYTVTFNANGGTTTTSTKTVTYGDTYGTLPTPTRTRYSFNGWYTAASGGTQITSSSLVSTTSNQTLYAQWTARTVSGTKIRNLKPTGLETTARNGMYRFKGTTANNYVNLDGVLYRIVGITTSTTANTNLGIEANQLKLVKATAIGSVVWHSALTSNTTWQNSEIRTYLQGSNVLSNTSVIPSAWKNKIDSVKWYQGTCKTTSGVSTIIGCEDDSTTSSSYKIGLIYLSDFYYSISNGASNSSGYYKVASDSWLGKNDSGTDTTHWTMTRYGYHDDGYYSTWTASSAGCRRPGTSTSIDTRPTFYLLPDVTYVSGTGTKSNPFILE